MRTALRTIRRLLDAALVLLVVTIFGLVLASNASPVLGHKLVVIRGGSMSPAIPLGSIVDVVRVQAADLRPGDVVTMTEPGGTVITHRVVRVVQLPDGLYIETKGDANDKVDVPLQSVSIVTGRADLSLSVLGYLMYLLTIPSGVLSMFSFAITLLMMSWLLEDLERDRDEPDEEPAAGDAAVSTIGIAGRR
jgi:signal peptidase I